MSHITRRASQMKNEDLIKKAAAQIPGATFLGRGQYRLYSSNPVGVGVSLPGYSYPIVVNTTTGEISADTYGRRWGDPALQDKLSQHYGIEAARAEAVRLKAGFTEEMLKDGSVCCKIIIGDGPQPAEAASNALPTSGFTL